MAKPDDFEDEQSLAGSEDLEVINADAATAPEENHSAKWSPTHLHTFFEKQSVVNDWTKLIPVKLDPATHEDLPVTHNFYHGPGGYLVEPYVDTNEDTDDSGEVIPSIIQIKRAILNATGNSGQPYMETQPIIIPLMERRGVFGGYGSKREHWVTLHYDPMSNTATLIDSRPAYVSRFYDLDPLKKKLAEGLPGVTFNTHFLGVQEKDINCGQWAATVAQDLANGKSIDVVCRSYTAGQEQEIVKARVEEAGFKYIPPAPSLWQRIKNFFANLFSFSEPVTAPTIKESKPEQPGQSSWVKMLYGSSSFGGPAGPGGVWVGRNFADTQNSEPQNSQSVSPESALHDDSDINELYNSDEEDTASEHSNYSSDRVVVTPVSADSVFLQTDPSSESEDQTSVLEGQTSDSDLDLSEDEEERPSFK